MIGHCHGDAPIWVIALCVGILVVAAWLIIDSFRKH